MRTVLRRLSIRLMENVEPVILFSAINVTEIYANNAILGSL